MENKEKIKEEIAQKRYGSLKSEVERWLLSTNGNFLSTDIYKELHLSTREEKKNLSIILKRLTDDNIIEKFGNKHGSWRKKDLSVNRIDWKRATGDSLNIRWPFGLERYYMAKPKNVIIIGGSPDSGKTAFCLNVVAENAGTYPIRYLSSEMGEDELKSRIDHFEDKSPFELCEFEERSFDFHDRIEPNWINIVDFMEMYDNFYLVSSYIREIWNKLDQGIAIICLQKNTGSENPLGGERAKEKARLVVNLDHGIAKITKAKNWTNPEVSPNRRTLEYKLHKGCHFQIVRDWELPEVVEEATDWKKK